MTANNRIIAATLILCLAAIACTLPSGAETATPVASATSTFTAVPLETASPTPTQCSPIVTANTDANVRNGPGTVYGIAGQIPAGGTAPLAGRNAEGTWWTIVFAGGIGGYGWIAGSVSTATCVPPTLPVIAAPPTPVIPPTNTPLPSNTPVPPSNTPVPSATPTLFIFPFPTFPILPCPFC